MTYDNYKDVALDLSLDLKAAHERISSLEKALDKARNTLYQMRGTYPPAHEDGVTWCPKCGEDIPDESWSYCPACGVHFRWHEIPDDEAFDRWRDEQMAVM